jgi:hypothetical protein
MYPTSSLVVPLSLVYQSRVEKGTSILPMLCIKVCGLFYYSLSNLSKYFREYASLLSHDFRIFTNLGE